MSLVPADLVTDLDLLALDSSILEAFGETSIGLDQKRAVAVRDWLQPKLEVSGLPPSKHMSRRVPSAAWAQTAGGFTDQKSTYSTYQTTVPINSLIVAPASDALYLAMPDPYRGVWVGMEDAVNVNSSAVASITYWAGSWKAPNSVVDGTQQTSAASFGAGGRIMWTVGDDWMPRQVGPPTGGIIGYWVRLQVSALPTTPTVVTQFLPIARSRFSGPLAAYTAYLVYLESMAAQRGDWQEKAKMYLELAESALDMAISLARDEFDMNDSGAVDPSEANSVTMDVWTWERG